LKLEAATVPARPEDYHARNEQERAQVADLARAIQEATGESVELAYVDQGYTCEQAEKDARAHGIKLKVVKLEKAKNGFVLLPRRWVVERSCVGGAVLAARFRRLTRDYEKLPQTLAGLHFIAFSCLMFARIASHIAQNA